MKIPFCNTSTFFGRVIFTGALALALSPLAGCQFAASSVPSTPPATAVAPTAQPTDEALVKIPYATGKDVLKEMKEDRFLSTHVLPTLIGHEGMFSLPGAWEEQWKVRANDEFIFVTRSFHLQGDEGHNEDVALTCAAEKDSAFPIAPGPGNCNELITPQSGLESVARYHLDGDEETLLQINGGAFDLSKLLAMSAITLPPEVQKAIEAAQAQHPNAQLAFGTNMVLVSSQEYQESQQFQNPAPTPQSTIVTDIAYQVTRSSSGQEATYQR